MKRRHLGLALTWLAGSVAWGCGGAGLEGSFQPGWQWDQGESARLVVARVHGQPGVARVAAAVGVTGPGLSGRRLPDGPLWTYEGEVDVLPSIVGNVVGFTGNDKVTLLDVTTGQVRFSIPAGDRRLEGLGYDGKMAVLMLVDKDDARPDLVAVVDELGHTRFSTTTLEHVGTPAALGGVGFVPWSHQYVSVFDLSTGQNLGRVLVRDATSRAETEGPNVIFFGQGAVLLSDALAQNPDQPSLRLPKRTFPGEPTWPIDGSKPRPVRAQSATIDARPEVAGASLAFASAAYTVSYFEIALGLEASSGSVRWATHFERSIVGSRAGHDALGVCLEDGALHEVNLVDGAQKPMGSLDTRLKACVISDVPSFGAAATTPNVDEQILTAVTDTGASMAAMHAWLVEELAGRTGSSATGTLLAIARDPLTSTPVVERASAALGRRSDGADVMLQALEESAPPPPIDTSKKPIDKKAADKTKKPAAASPTAGTGKPAAAPSGATAPSDSTLPPTDGLPQPERRSSKRPPPLAALAQALLAMGERRAAAPLARHLATPSINAEQASAVLDALKQLGGPSEVPAVLDFFATYRAAGGEPEFIEALARAGRFVRKNGSPAERDVIEKATTDTVTHPDLRKLLTSAAFTVPAAVPAAAPATAPAPVRK